MARPWSPETMPFIGPTIANVGKVLSITARPCSPRPSIAVYATFTYLPTLIWALAKPDPLDLAFDRAGRPHKRVRKRRLKVADVMQLPEPTKPGPSLALFRAAQFGQRVGWYFLIADATSEYAVNWTSMLYQWSGCDVPGLPSGRSYGGPVKFGGGNGEWTAVVILPESEFTIPGWANQGRVSIPRLGPKTCHATLTCSVTSYNGSDPEMIGVDLVMSDDKGKYVTQPMTGTGNMKGVSHWAGSMTVHYPQAPGCSFYMILKCRDPWLTVLEGNIEADGAPPGGIKPDP